MSTGKDNLSEAIMSIGSDRLNVEVAKPGTIYCKSRFDWTGFITQVTLDGKHKFCVPESLESGQGTGGHGLCNEFGIDSAIGYDDCKPGEQFPKIGVGLLTKTSDEPYGFYKPYGIKPFKIDIVKGAASIIFKVKPEECRGYAVEFEKSISVEENSLLIQYKLKNCGSAQISTSEYCHNFFGIDGHKVGPDYQLIVPNELKTENASPILDIKRNRISWHGTPAEDFYCRCDSFQRDGGPYWELMHMPTGVGVREFGDFAVFRFALWGGAHVISPEVFVDINIKPGETFTWQRRHEFFD